MTHNLFMEQEKEMHPSMQRLYQACAAIGSITHPRPSDIALFAKSSPQAINNWAKRGISREGALNIEKLRGVRAAWLMDGVGEMRAPNVEPAMDMSGKKYPLVSFVQAGGWTEICDNFQPGDADEWYPSAKNLGPHGYMLRVRGKSMYAPGQKYSFDEGMLLHVNPSMEPVPGQFVIVRRNGSQEATFKRYILIDGQPYLEAINPDWPKEEKYLKLLPGDDWCGVVVDASMNTLP